MSYKPTAKEISELRSRTGAGIGDCKAALEEANGDMDRAGELLRKKGIAKAEKRAGRSAQQGLVVIELAADGKSGGMVEVNCETDFVARSEAFRNLAHEIALQIAASSPQWLTEEEVDPAAIEREKQVALNTAKEAGKPEASWDKIAEGRVQKFLDENVLLRQGYIRDDSKTIKDMISEGVVATGENIVVRRFARWELGGK